MAPLGSKAADLVMALVGKRDYSNKNGPRGASADLVHTAAGEPGLEGPERGGSSAWAEGRRNCLRPPLLSSPTPCLAALNSRRSGFVITGDLGSPSSWYALAMAGELQTSLEELWPQAPRCASRAAMAVYRIANVSGERRSVCITQSHDQRERPPERRPEDRTPPPAPRSREHGGAGGSGRG